jgi:hypothetical protein
MGRIVAVGGPAGAGKDTIADHLVTKGFCKLSFADEIYKRVSDAYGVDEALLRRRDTKEMPSSLFSPIMCEEVPARKMFTQLAGDGNTWLSPRKVLQWWGTEYGRNTDDEVWVNIVKEQLDNKKDYVIADLRFEVEWRMLKGKGAQIWKVLREPLPPVSSHVSEEYWRIMPADILLDNNSTAESLLRRVDSI